MNRNGRAAHLGRFIVDYFSNSIKYIYKMIVTDSLKASEEMTNILNEVVADLKQRVEKNLLGLLLTVGETYRTFTKDKRLKEYLKQEEMLQKTVEEICLSQTKEESQ